MTTSGESVNFTSWNATSTAELLVTSPVSSFQGQSSTFAVKGGPPSDDAMGSSLLGLVIGLAVSTGLFFVTTILLCVLLTVTICKQRMRQREIEKTKDAVFEGCNQSSHWIDTPAMQIDGDTQPAELPIWSVQTFTTTGGNPSSPPSTPNQSTSNTITSEMTPQKLPPPPSMPPTPPSMPSTSKKIKIIPKRVAPPPPKEKKRKKGSSSKVMHEAAEYAVPVTHHWYNWNKKKSQHRSPYKELDLTKVESPSVYSKPNVVV